MIDVPARVKDALRSGDYKKEYKIHVGRYREAYYRKIGDIDLTEYAEWSPYKTTTLHTYGSNYKSDYIHFDESVNIRLYPNSEPSNVLAFYWERLNTEHDYRYNAGAYRQYGYMSTITYGDMAFEYEHKNVNLNGTTLKIEKEIYRAKRISNFTVNQNGSYKFYSSYGSFSTLKITLGSESIVVNASTDTGGVYAIVDLQAYYEYTLDFSNCNVRSIDYAIKEINEFVEETVLDNSRLVAESVKFDERMCSDTELKFGLCEGTSVEFQYFNYDNIRGKHINIELNVQYKNENNTLAWHTIPMGQYDVDECSRQASTGIIKAVAYNKLKSAYLDQRANQSIIETLDHYPDDSTNLYILLKQLLEGYGIADIGEEELNILHNRMEVGVEARGVRKAEYIWDPVGGEYYWKTLYGHYFTVYEKYVKIHFPSDWISGGQYRFILKTKRLLNAISATFSEQRNPCPSYPNDYGNYANIGISLHGAGYTPPAQGCYLPDFIISNHPYAKYFQGCYEIKKTDGTVIATFPAMTEFDNYNTEANYHTNFMTDIYSEEFTSDNSGIVLYVHMPVGFDPDFLYDDHLDVTTIYDFTDRIMPTISDFITTHAYFDAEGTAIYARHLGGDINEIVVSKSEFENISEDITLRDLQSAVFEANCQYGKLDRVTDLFAGIELNEGALYPRDNLYPANDLLPMGTSEAGYPAMYSKLWADEGNVRTFRYLIITYKAMENGQEVEKKLQRTVNTHGTDDYNMSDNWLFRNLVWTAEQVGAYADAMVAKMQNISWFPFEMWCAGLPYLEAGDAIEIAMQQGTYKSYVLRRNLNGIQNLQDEMINGTLDIF